MRHSILVVDDEEIIRTTLDEFLSGEGFRVRTAGTAAEALDAARREHFAIAVCDVQLPDFDGVTLLDRLLKISPETFVLIITAYATVESAVEAFKAGAHDYLIKPVQFDDLLHKVRHLVEYRELFLENQLLRRELARWRGDDRIVGSSPAMQEVFRMVAKVAQTRSNVLLEGESGTGKELVARAIHQGGAAALPGRTGAEEAAARSNRPSNADARRKFIAVNCAAIPADLMESQLFGHRRGAFTGADRDLPGLFLAAGTGTLFLDEITEVPLHVQAKLLRAIEEKEILPVGASEPVPVHPRIIAATNRNLDREVADGRFREDLYYRLNVVRIALPALRERPEDIPELVDFLLARQTARLGKRVKGVSGDTMRLLMAHNWKGNVRELDNALERAVIMCEGDTITPSDLPPHLCPFRPAAASAGSVRPSEENRAPGERPPDMDLRAALRRYERLHIERVLAANPDKREAARLLGLGLSSLYRKIDELQIRASD